MTLVNPATDDERTGAITDNGLDELERGQPSDVLVLDLRLREVEAFAAISEIAGSESARGRPTRALAVRCLAARVASQRTFYGAPESSARSFAYGEAAIGPCPLARRSEE